MSAYKVHSRPYLVAGGAAALIRQIEQLDTADTLKVADALPRLHIPARIVWGEDDHFQKLEYGERFARDLDAPLRLIRGGKHFTPEDHPIVLADEIMILAKAVASAQGPTLKSASDQLDRNTPA